MSLQAVMTSRVSFWCVSVQHGGQKLSVTRVSPTFRFHLHGPQLCVCVLGSNVCVCMCVVSLPQLKELDWRVDMVTGSDSVSRMSVPTCLVQFKVSTDPNLRLRVLTSQSCDLHLHLWSHQNQHNTDHEVKGTVHLVTSSCWWQSGEVYISCRQLHSSEDYNSCFRQK